VQTSKRKELLNSYKDTRALGAVYAIQCGGNGKRWVKSTTNLAGQQNRFQFALMTNGCPEPAMRAEWEKYGAKAFSFVVLEELKQKETQTESEFAEDISLLLEIWQEKSKTEGGA